MLPDLHGHEDVVPVDRTLSFIIAQSFVRSLFRRQYRSSSILSSSRLLGALRRIHDLNMWPLYLVLCEKYRFATHDALVFSDFLMQMLRWKPEERVPIDEMLAHPWLDIQV